MKRHFIILLTIPFLLCSCLRSLEKEGIKAETTYKGRVIDSNNKPLEGIMVRITNGSLIYNSVATDKDGIFQIVVDVAKIDNTYYIQIGEDGTLVKRSSLKGFGQNVYDYGDIPFVNINLPEVETVELEDMTPHSFTCKCNVTSEGASVVTERGLCWSTNVPTIEDNREKSGSGKGLYTCVVSKESFDFNTTTYYARAYAINEYGVSYGESIEISPDKFAEFMKIKYPVVITLGLTDMSATSFTCQCNVTSQGGALVTERGLCWSISIPTIEDNREKSGVGEGIYTCVVSKESLDFNTTTYYARAYAINEYGVSYGELVEINSMKLDEFMAIKLPVVETIGLTAMTSNSFTCKCNVMSQGKAIVTERGLCWSTNIPTIDDNKEEYGSGEGIYVCTVSNLNFESTTYYARAYAVNEYGVSYGDPIEINSSKQAYYMLPTMEFGGYTYHIHPDIGMMYLLAGCTACNQLETFGFDDWFLPNLEEMIAIARNTNALDTINDVVYWTNTTDGTNKAYCLHHLTGEWKWELINYYSYMSNVVPARKEKK